MDNLLRVFVDENGERALRVELPFIDTLMIAAYEEGYQAALEEAALEEAEALEEDISVAYIMLL